MESISNYRIGKTIGVGSYGKVKSTLQTVGEHIDSRIRVAIKFMSIEFLKQKHMIQKVRREITIMKRLNHPNIIKLYPLYSYEVQETTTKLILIMEYVPRSDLYNLLEKKGRIDETQSRKFLQQIISALEYCHKYKIVHRDIKPENILLDDDYNIKLADFGLSNFMHDGKFFQTSCGSPNYAAPEVISGELYCGPEVDIWSTGVVLYALLAGKLPFDEEIISSLFNKIKRGDYQMPHHLSDEVKDLIRRILQPDPIRRINISQIKRHPWFNTDMPMYLKLHEEIMDTSAVVSLMQYRALKSYHGIDETVFAKCMEYPQYVIEDQQELRKQLAGNDDTPFKVLYNLIYDEFHRKQREILNERREQLAPAFSSQVNLTRGKHFRISADTDQARPFGVDEAQWHYGMRVNLGKEQLVLYLFGYLAYNNFVMFIQV